MKFRLTLLALLVAMMFVTAASASVVGSFDLANSTFSGGACTTTGGGGVTVTAGTIDWLPAGGGFGCFATGTGGTLTFAGGAGFNTVSQAGTILDLPPVPVSGFMTFVNFPQLVFDLASFGSTAGVSTTCAGLAIGQSCVAFAGSPFILTATATGTSVSLTMMGTARDGVTPNNPWTGIFTSQFVGVSPATIQTTINTGGSLTNTYSANVTVTVGPSVPEPMSFLLIGTGLVGLAFVRRLRRS